MRKFENEIYLQNMIQTRKLSKKIFMEREDRIRLFNHLFQGFCYGSASVLFVTLFSIIFFVGRTGLKTFETVPLHTFFFSLEWVPQEDLYGAALFIIGTLLLTALTLSIAVPISILLAVFTAEIAPRWLKKFMRSTLDLLVGIPSIVYGYLGLTVLLPLIREITGEPLGDGLMAAALVLSLMILPTITRLSDDAITVLPKEYREAAYALGSTRLKMIQSVLLPAAKDGIITAIILGMARAVGETMAVVMVIGNVAQLPSTLFTPTSVLTSNIVMQILNVYADSAWSHALYMMAFILLLISLLMIGAIRMIRVKGEKIS